MALAIPYIFVNGSAADADEVNADFNAVVDYVNNEVMLRDGTFSFNSDVDFNNHKLLRIETPTNASDGANKAYVDAISSPIGIVQIFAGPDNKIPLKWIKCDGRAISRVTYSELFNIVGVFYGPGDGATTFNVPNLQSKVPVGMGSGQFATLGATGGSPDIVVAEHEHTVTDPGHGHSYTDQYRSTNAAVASGSSYGYNPDLTNSYKATGQASTNMTIAKTGVDPANKNYQPYQVLNYIIRTGV